MPVHSVSVSRVVSGSQEDVYQAFFQQFFLPPIEEQGYLVKFTENTPGDVETKAGLSRSISTVNMIEKIIATDAPNSIEYEIAQAGCISPAANYTAKVEFKTSPETNGKTEVIWSGSFESSNFTAYFLVPLLRMIYGTFISQLAVKPTATK